MNVAEIQEDYQVNYATAIKIKTKLLAYDAVYEAELTGLRDLLRDWYTYSESTDLVMLRELHDRTRAILE